MSHKKRGRTNSPAPDKHKHSGGEAAPVKAAGVSASEPEPASEPRTAFEAKPENSPATGQASELNAAANTASAQEADPAPNGAAAAEAESPAPEATTEAMKDASPESLSADTPPTKDVPGEKEGGPDKLTATETERPEDAPAKAERPASKAAENTPDKPALGKSDSNDPAADQKGFNPPALCREFRRAGQAPHLTPQTALRPAWLWAAPFGRLRLCGLCGQYLFKHPGSGIRL